MREAMFYEQEDDGDVTCNLCPFHCRVAEGETGRCRVRKNKGGKLYSLVFDKLSAANPDAIEKKPAYHFAPDTRTFSIATPGCNWQCQYCQNWTISQGKIEGRSMTPEEIVRQAKDSNCRGISYTYGEPTVFYELTYETAKLAHKEGLYNTYVTNGYINPEPIKKIGPFLDQATINFKGSGDPQFLQKFASVPQTQPIYRALEEYKQQEVLLEITDLIVPQVGDSMEQVEKLVDWIVDKLGADTPLHFLRFVPHYQVKDLPPTPLETLREAYQRAKDQGLNYVYLGNVGDKNNTHCPQCGQLIIERQGMRTLNNRVEDNSCPDCGAKINLSGQQYVK